MRIVRQVRRRQLSIYVFSSLKTVAEGAFALEALKLDPLPPSNGVAVFVRSHRSWANLALTNGSVRRIHSPTLTSGSPPPSYHTFSSRASSPPPVPSDNPPPYSLHRARPAPPIPQPPNQPPNRPPNRPPGIQPPIQPFIQPPILPPLQPFIQPPFQPPFQPPGPRSYFRPNAPYGAEPSTKISCGPATCFVIMLLLLEAILISRSESLAKFISHESTARRASWESSSLVTEREKSEREREKMRRDRELWEKPLEDRVPQGASWEVVWPAWECRAYGMREYWGTLRNIPAGWSAVDACMNMPVEIKGVTVRRPNRCAFVEGSPDIHGYWMVDWDQADCKPWHQDFRDAVSPMFPSSLSGRRRFGSHIPGMYELRVRRP